MGKINKLIVCITNDVRGEESDYSTVYSMLDKQAKKFRTIGINLIQYIINYMYLSKYAVLSEFKKVLLVSSLLVYKTGLQQSSSP